MEVTHVEHLLLVFLKCPYRRYQILPPSGLCWLLGLWPGPEAGRSLCTHCGPAQIDPVGAVVEETGDDAALSQQVTSLS